MQVKILSMLFFGVIFFVTGCAKSESNDKSAAKENSGEKGRNKGERSGIAKKGDGRGARAVVAVTAEKTVVRELERIITSRAIVEGIHQVDVYPKVTGRLASLELKAGDSVRKGSILFKVNRSEPGETYLETPVHSPIEGWIGRWMISDLGAQVTAQEPVVTVLDDSKLKAKVFLPEDVWLQVRSGQEVIVKFESMKKTGRVVRSARAIDAEMGRGEVQVEWDNSDRSWRAGLLATFQFTYDRKPRILIPSEALSITDDGAYVFISEGGKARRQKVEFSVFDFDRVEIKSGVDAGQDLIKTGLQQISDGSSIQIVSDEKDKA